MFSLYQRMLVHLVLSKKFLEILTIICKFVTEANITKLNALSEYRSYDKINLY